MSRGDSIEVALSPDLQLVLLLDDQFNGSQSASIWQGRKRISTTVFAKDTARVAVQDGDATLWLGGTLFDLPWLELLKVADFLRLPIDVPATEMVEVKS